MGLTALERAGRGIGRVVLKDSAGRSACDDPDIRAIVVGPEGANFPVGGDLGRLSDHPSGQASHRRMRSVADLALLSLKIGLVPGFTANRGDV